MNLFFGPDGKLDLCRLSDNDFSGAITPSYLAYCRKKKAELSGDEYGRFCVSAFQAETEYRRLFKKQTESDGTTSYISFGRLHFPEEQLADFKRMKVAKDTAASECFQVGGYISVKSGDLIGFFDGEEKHGATATVAEIKKPWGLGADIRLTHARTLMAGWEVKPIAE